MPTIWLPTVAEMEEIDRRAIASAIPERALIENAGRALAARLHSRWPAGRVVALVGSGHNGADALVALRTLRAWGRDVSAVRCGTRAPDPDVLVGWDIGLADPDDLANALSAAGVVIDGILGTGLTAAPREPQASMIEAVNASSCAVVACDGPSGVELTTGHVPGSAIRADLTVTFGWPKLGMLRFPGRELCGDIEVVEIGFPPPQTAPRARMITPAWAAAVLGSRGADSHKGRAGYLAIVGGRSGMAGAVVLAARAAIRSGAGVVRVVSAPENREIVQTAVPAAVFVPWDDPDALAEATESADAIAVGPGLGDHVEPLEVCLDAGRPVVCDADALNLLAADPAMLDRVPASAVLTPHPGEMGRLLEHTGAEVATRPMASAMELAARTGAAVVLKGTPTVVSDAEGALRVSPLASPAFAAGGMGDVLTGVIGSYAAAGLAGPDAAMAALTVTGLATLAAPDPVGHTAEDVPDRLPPARASLDRLPQGAEGGVIVAIPAALGGDA